MCPDNWIYFFALQDFPDPDFTVCEYKHPEKYDVYRLPLAGQCYVDEDCYVQRLFVKIKDLKVRCPEQLTMEELDWPTLLSDALEILEPKDFPGLGTVETVDELSSSLCDSNSICNALLSINRYMNINVDLSCLKDVYGTAQAAELTVALDSYFEQFIVPKIEKTVETVCPTSSAYSVKSPFSSEGDVEFCYYPASYADGTIADQYVAGDGNIVTTFKCAFDLVWFKDKNCSDSLLPDFVTSVQEAFQEDSPSFLTFLQEMYSTEIWVQPITSCGVIDPNIDLPNPTQSPTQSPMSVPTTSPTDGPTAAVCYDVCFLSFLFCFRCFDPLTNILFLSPLFDFSQFKAQPQALQNPPRTLHQVLLLLLPQLIRTHPLKAQPQGLQQPRPLRLPVVLPPRPQLRLQWRLRHEILPMSRLLLQW